MGGAGSDFLEEVDLGSNTLVVGVGGDYYVVASVTNDIVKASGLQEWILSMRRWTTRCQRGKPEHCRWGADDR